MAAARGWIETASRFLAGDDVFVCYARGDALDYALNLASALTDAEVSCYLDQWQLSPGQELPRSLQLRLRRSSLLVIIGTSFAAASLPVAQEIDLFLTTGRPILPVDVDGAIAKATWYPRLQRLPVTSESSAALLAAKPSPLVIQRVTSALGFHRRNRRLRRVFHWTAVAIGLLVALGSASAAWLWGRAREALEQKQLADAAAEPQGRIAASRRVAGYAAAQAVDVPDLALLLATYAADTYVTFEATRQQMGLLLKHPNLTGMVNIDSTDVSALAVSPAPDDVAVTAGSSLVLVDSSTHRRRGCALEIPNPETALGTLRYPDWILTLAFSPDGNRLFGRGALGGYLWDLPSGVRFAMPTGSLTLAPSGELVTLDTDEDGRRGAVSFWDVCPRGSPQSRSHPESGNSPPSSASRCSCAYPSDSAGVAGLVVDCERALSREHTLRLAPREISDV